MLFLCFLLLVSCRTKTADLKTDLTQYVDKARLWAATESQINTAIAAVREDQFVHDDFVAHTLRPAVGVAQEYVQQLESYRPAAAPLRNVHQEYIEAWRAHYFAMASIVDAVEKKDYLQLSKANNELLEAQRSVSDALADLSRLMRGAGLQSETPPEQPQQPPEGGFSVSPKGA